MNARARGFTLIEMLIVALLGALIMGAVYQTLTVQLRSNRQVNAVVSTQQTIRTAAQIMQSELREVGGKADDVLAASAQSLTVRALRKVAFACTDGGGSTVAVQTLGDPIGNKDSVVVYATKAPGSDDDALVRAYVNSDPSSGGCTKLTGTPWDSLKSDVRTLNLSMVAPAAVSDIRIGDPIRSFEVITYGIFLKGGRYVLGRRLGSDSVVTLVGPLASPAAGGLVLTYYSLKNTLLDDAALTSQAKRDSIARVNIRIKGSARGAPGSPSGVYQDSLVADIFLRGN